MLLGPYANIDKAQHVSDAVAAGFGLSPSVVVGSPLGGTGDGDGNGNGSSAP